MITRKNKIRRGKKSKKNKTQVGGSDTSMIQTLEGDKSTKEILKFYGEFKDTNIPELFKEIETYRDGIPAPSLSISGVDTSGQLVLHDVNKINEVPQVFDKSSILVCTAHGAIDDEYITVPPNTIICFMSPLPYLNNISGNEYYNYMNTLSVVQFEQLLKLRTYNRNVKFINRYGHFGCLKNSIWYYPQQKVPNTMQVIYKKEYKAERKFFFELTMTKSRIFRKNKIHKQDLFPKIFGKDKFLDADFNSDQVHEFLLSDILDNLDIRPGGFRLIIFDSCRCFDDNIRYQKQKKMIELEFYYSRLNAINDETILTTKQQLPVNNNKIKFQCNLCYLSSMNEIYIKDNEELSKLNFKTNLKKYCYHSQTQHLIKMAKNFNELEPSKFNKDELGYLATQSVMKILKFFSTDTMSKVGNEKMGLILAGLFKSTSAKYFRRIMSSLDYFESKLHLVNFKNVEYLKHYIGGIHYLFYYLDTHKVDIRLEVVKKIRQFVESCDSNPLIQYLIDSSLNEIQSRNDNKLVAINNLDELKSQNLLGKNLSFSFDILQSLEGGDHELKSLFTNFKGLRELNALSIRNLNADGEIDNPSVETLFLKSSNPAVTYNINCLKLKKLDIKGVKFTNSNFRHLEKLYLSNTEFEVNDLAYTKTSLTELTLIDVSCNVDRLFDTILGFLKNLKSVYLCGLKDNSRSGNPLGVEFLKNLLKLDYLHISSMPSKKLNYVELVKSILPTRINKILLEIKEVDAIVHKGASKPEFISVIPAYQDTYNKLVESIV